MCKQSLTNTYKFWRESLIHCIHPDSLSVCIWGNIKKIWRGFLHCPAQAISFYFILVHSRPYPPESPMDRIITPSPQAKGFVLLFICPPSCIALIIIFYLIASPRPQSVQWLINVGIWPRNALLTRVISGEVAQIVCEQGFRNAFAKQKWSVERVVRHRSIV